MSVACPRNGFASLDDVRPSLDGQIRITEKGIANHLESESCAGARKAALEALPGTYAGRDMELQIGNPRADGLARPRRQ